MEKIKGSQISLKPPFSPREPHSQKICLRVYNSQKDLKISKTSVRRLVVGLLDKLNIVTEELIVHFVSEKRICQIHKDFFDDPSPTDCISFPIDETLLGEIFICPLTAISYAQKHGDDPYKEASLYLVHGILHLIGYDDIAPADRKIMKREEKRCMKFLEKERLFLEPSCVKKILND